MNRFVKAYLPFSLNEIKRQMAYKGAFIIFVFVELMWPFINYYLWMAIYGSNGNGILGNLTRNEMIIYVFMSYIAAAMVMIPISEDMSEDIQQGSVVMNLIKPIDYRGSLIAKAFGKFIYYFFVPTLFIWIGIELYKVFGIGMGVTPIPQMLLFFVSCFFSFLIYVMFDFCFGMIGFYTTYLFGLNMVKSAILGVLTGQLIPMSFFPELVQKAFEFLPFSSMVYVPTMIYLGKYTTSELLIVMGRQIVWIVLLYLLGGYFWKKITKRLVVLGG